MPPSDSSDSSDSLNNVLTVAQISEAIKELTYALRWMADSMDNPTHQFVYSKGQPLRGSADRIDGWMRMDTTQPRGKG